MNVDVEMTAKFSRDDIIALIRQQLKQQGYSIIGEPNFNIGLDTRQDSSYVFRDHVFKDIDVKVRPLD